MKTLLSLLLLLKVATHAFAQPAGKAAQWKGLGVSEGAPLPPAEKFQPRLHDPEATKAGLRPDVLAKLDIELQRQVAARNVAGIAAIIRKNGQRGHFKTFRLADIEQNRPVTKDAIFRLMSMTKTVSHKRNGMMRIVKAARYFALRILWRLY